MITYPETTSQRVFIGKKIGVVNTNFKVRNWKSRPVFKSQKIGVAATNMYFCYWQH